MTQEEKELLLKDLCARLPYDVMVECSIESGESIDLILNTSHIDELVNDSLIIKPYLRLMSSMTEEEREKYRYGFGSDIYGNIKRIDWLNAHHFDYRGLIPMRLAFKAPKNMYKIE